MTKILLELQAFSRCFYYHEGNSDVQKTVLYVGLGVVSLIVLGQAFGLVNYDKLPEATKALIYAFSGAVVYLMGMTHGKERELAKKEP